MNIEELDTITLDDDNDYFVVKKINEGGINYYYISNENDYTDIKLLYEDNDNTLTEVEDKETIRKIINLIGASVDSEEIIKLLEQKSEEPEE